MKHLKIKHHEIKLEDLQKWLQEEDVVFASSARENKRLRYCFDGYLEVVVDSTIIWRGKQSDVAVYEYNAITAAWVNPLKDFRV